MRPPVPTGGRFSLVVSGFQGVRAFRQAADLPSDHFAILMNSRNSNDEPNRFSGHVRHYHRSGAKPLKSWDEWVNGKSVKNSASRNWIRIAAVLVAILALAGIITSLIVELG